MNNFRIGYAELGETDRDEDRFIAGLSSKGVRFNVRLRGYHARLSESDETVAELLIGAIVCLQALGLAASTSGHHQLSGIAPLGISNVL